MVVSSFQIFFITRCRGYAEISVWLFHSLRCSGGVISCEVGFVQLKEGGEGRAMEDNELGVMLLPVRDRYI